jgi:hypothetical protein
MLHKPPITAIVKPLGIANVLLEALGSPKASAAAFTNAREHITPLI